MSLLATLAPILAPVFLVALGGYIWRAPGSRSIMLSLRG